MSSQWYMYVVECDDETLYTGITTDPERRLHEHNHTTRGARYTRSRRPVALRATWSFESRSDASKAEWAFKRLSRDEKLRRIDDAQQEDEASPRSEDAGASMVSAPTRGESP